MPAAAVTPSYLSRSTSGFAPSYSPGGSHLIRSSEDEVIVLDIGARYLRGGFSGEAHPRCVLEFNPEGERRVGDYRGVIPIHMRSEEKSGPKRTRIITKRTWAKEYTLWTNDLRDTDLGLVEDRLERMLRKAYNEYFLLDKPRKVLLAVDTLIPRQLLGSILKLLFTNFSAPSVSLLSPAVLAAVAAGSRSGMVVDIGWEETRVTAVYEYREVLQRSSTRAGREASWEMREILREQWLLQRSQEHTGGAADDQELEVTFEQADEVLQRMGWCTSATDAHAKRHNDGTSEAANASSAHDEKIPITLPNTFPPLGISIPFSQLSLPAEEAFFSPSSPSVTLDTHNRPLHELLYLALLALDVIPRDTCMSHIIITGGCSSIPGVKSRLLSSLYGIVAKRGWDPVHSYGKVSPNGKTKFRTDGPQAVETSKIDQVFGLPTTQEAATENDAPTQHRNFSRPMGTPTPHSSIVGEMQRLKLAEENAPVTGQIRGLDSLGVWTGGSLIAALRVTGKVEVEREKYQREGISTVGGLWG